MLVHYKKYKHDNHVCDYDDMIRDFIDKAVEPDIDALIVDEAQDSNVPQRKALELYLNLQEQMQIIIISYQEMQNN